MLFDPLYLILVLLPGLAISGIASWMVKSNFNKYSRVGTRNGYTGAQAAQKLLDNAGIHDVEVVATRGYLSDHYNPTTKQLALSEPVYASNSVAAVGVAVHEAGHAIQHARGYWPMYIRSAIVPLANIGSSIGYFTMFGGLILMSLSRTTQSQSLGQWIIIGGALMFSMVLLFQLITLPVEFDASNRAKRLVVESGIISDSERVGVDKVLNAAALTYVAAVISTALTLLYFLIRSGLLSRR